MRWNDVVLELTLPEARAYEANRELICTKKRQHRSANIEKARERERLWSKSHPQKRRAGERNVRAYRKGATGRVTPEDVAAQYARQRGKCFWCEKKLGNRYHVDHVVPLVKGGTNHPTNIVVACAPCNQSKSARMPSEFAGRLL